MKRRTFLALMSAIAAIALTLSAQGQFGQGYTSSQPWLDFKLDSKKKVQVNFQNASVNAVMRFIGQATGITMIKDPSLNAAITLSTAKPVSLNEIMSMFAAAMDLQGFELRKQDTFLVIRKKAATPQRSSSGFVGPSGSGFGGPGSGGQQSTNELRTYSLQFASATSVAKTINEVFGQGSTSTFGGPGFGGGPGSGGPGGGGPGGGGLGGPPPGGGSGGNAGGGQAPEETEAGPSVQAERQGQGGATTQGSGQGGPPGGFGGPPGFGGPGGMPGGFGGGFGQGRGNSGNNVVVRASADEYSNTVIVNAPSSLHSQIAAFIKVIDREVKQPYTTQAYPLQYVSASSLVSTIDGVLTATANKGRGASTTSSNNYDPIWGRILGNNSSSRSSGSVLAEAHTNSLIVTTTEALHQTVAALLAKIDKSIPYANATSVVVLENARATDMATLLNQAFSGRSTTTRSTASNTNRSTTSNTNQNRQPAGGQSFGPGGNASPGTSDLNVQLQDPNATSGDLLTSIGVAQGLGGFGGFGGQSSTTNRSTTANQETYRDAQGRIVNVSDLSGRVTIVADPNTNSLIIVGDPEAVALLKEMLVQLDRIPEQVMIETMIVEASLTKDTQFGLNWSYVQNKAFGKTGVTGKVEGDFGLNTAGEGFRYTLTSAGLNAFLNALKSDQKFHVLSTPRIFTSNNVEASINISQSVPYITSQREDANGNITYSYSFQDVGIVLTVTPRISASGAVSMEISQTANELQGFTTFNAPIVNQREANTTVSVQNGETIVLGGIMRQSVSATTKKIPLLGDIPVLGNIFRSTIKTEGATELLVFLTPKIVKNQSDAKAMTDKQKSEMTPEARKILQRGGG